MPRVCAAGALAATVGIALSAWGAMAEPEGACTVTVTPENSARPWVAAGLVARARLQHAPTESDCLALELRVSGDRALVVFTTRDGRRTVRRLDTPDEVGPVVDALLVNVADELPPPHLAAASPQSVVDPRPVDRAPAAAGPIARVVLRGSGGARASFGFPGSFVSPSLAAGAGVLVGAWEVSAFGRWDPMHVLLDRPTPGFTMSRYALGIALGRVVAASSASAEFGLSTSVAITFEDATGASGSNGGQSNGEPLVGLYAGFAYPRRSMLRLRTELTTDVVVYRAPSIDPALPALPLWSTTASVGAEWEVP